MTQVILVANLARMSDIHTRLKKLREEHGLSMEQLAEKIGVAWQTIQQWENGKTAPRRKRLEDVAGILSTTVEYLMLGREAESSHSDAGVDPRLVSVRYVIFKISTGMSGFSLDYAEDPSKDSLLFSRKSVERRGLDPQKLYATRVAGNSMDPTIRAGDVVVVDTSATKRAKNGIFAVSHQGEFAVMRLSYEERRWWLCSDNSDQKRYPRIESDDETQIIGRLVYLRREM